MTQWQRQVNYIMRQIDASITDIDIQIADEVEVRRDGKTVSCTTCKSPGCCYQPTIVSAGEALYIAWHLRKQGNIPKTTLTKWEQFGQETEDSTRKEHFYGLKPCIFLKDNLCSIYAFRPMVCRRYFVVSPSEDCWPPATNVTAINPWNIDGLWLRWMLTIEREIFQLRDKKPYMISLPRGVAVGLRALTFETQRETTRYLLAQKWITGDNTPMTQNLHDDIEFIYKTPRKQ